ncbi:MAG: family 10 glycosylhydrolase, partial [Melioribacteraceae bacterium]|nr:family 10 glycosylhydrolase [Melioribacteraceae bacterium]
NPKNSLIKIGATPIGIRKSLNGAIGWEGYSSVYQDTETWLREDLVDYLTPQIYWDFNKNPKFDILAKDWVEKSFNKNIVLGLAAYKPDVALEINDMINLSREIGAAGISFFRYANIAKKSDDYFQDFAFPPDMPWKRTSLMTLNSRISSTYSNISADDIILEWNDSSAIASNIFRNYVLLQNSIPIKFLGLDKQKLKLKFKRPSKLMYEYQICKLDRLWNFTSQSNSMKVNVPYLSELKKSSKINFKPILHKQDNEKVYILITANETQSIFLDTFNIENIRKQQIFELKMGMNICSIGENFKSIKTIRITYADNSIDELNIY